MLGKAKRIASAVGIGTLAQIAGCDGCDGYVTDPTPLKVEGPARVVAGQPATFRIRNQGTGTVCPKQAAFTFRIVEASTVVVQNPPTAVGPDGQCRVTVAEVQRTFARPRGDRTDRYTVTGELLGPDLRRAAGTTTVEVVQPSGTAGPSPTVTATPTPPSGFGASSSHDAGANPVSVDFADYNGAAAEGVGIAVAADEPQGSPGAVHVFFPQNGAGALGPSSLYPLPGSNQPSDMVGADFDGDGVRDLAVSDFGASAVNLLEGSASGTFGAAAPAPGDFRQPLGIDAGDLNGDGKPDLVTASPAAFGVAVALNATNGAAPSFAAPQYFVSGSTAVGSEAAPHAVAVGDLTRDGLPDIAVADPVNDRVSLLRNTTATGAAAASFAPFATIAQDAGRGPRDVVISDFNSDGRADLAVADQDRDTVTLFANTTSAGSDQFTATQTSHAVGDAPQALSPMRVGSDPFGDLAVANYGSADASILVNLGSGTPQVRLAAAESPEGVASADINGDGRGDLAVANNGERGVNFRRGSLTVARSRTPARSTAVIAQVRRGKGKRIRTAGSIDLGSRTKLGTASFAPDGTVHVENARLDGRMRLKVLGKRLPGEPKGLRSLLAAKLLGTVDFDRYIAPAEFNPVLARGILAGR